MFLSSLERKVLGKSFDPTDQRFFGVSSHIQKLKLILAVLSVTISSFKKHYLRKIDPEMNPIGRNPEIYKRMSLTDF